MISLRMDVMVCFFDHVDIHGNNLDWFYSDQKFDYEKK